MAEAKLREIGQAIRARWPEVKRVAIAAPHRPAGDRRVLRAHRRIRRAPRRCLRGVPLRHRHAQAHRARSGRRSTSRTARSGWACREAERGHSSTRSSAAIRRHAMLAGGETVLVAVSGGRRLRRAPAHRCASSRPTFASRLHVLHVDHGLRAESVRDAEFVRRSAPGSACRSSGARGRSGPARWRRAARDRALRRAGGVGRPPRRRPDRDRPQRGRPGRDRAHALARAAPGCAVWPESRRVRGRVDPPADRDAPATSCARRSTAAGLDWVEDPRPIAIRSSSATASGTSCSRCWRPRTPPTSCPRWRAPPALARETVDALDRAATGALERLATVRTTRSTLLARGARGAARAGRRRDAPPGRRALRQPRAAARLGAPRAASRAGPRPAPRPFRLGGVSVEVSGDRVRVGARRRRCHLRRGRSPCRVVSTCRRSAARCKRGWSRPPAMRCRRTPESRGVRRRPRAACDPHRSRRGGGAIASRRSAAASAD